MEVTDTKPATKVAGIIRRNMLTIVSVAILIIAALAISLVLLRTTKVDELRTIIATVDALKYTFLAIRATLFVSLVALWPKLIEWGSVHYKLSDIQAERMHALRWRVALWILLLELFIGQNILGKAFG